MRVTLSDWAKNDWLKPHKTSQQEIQNLLTIVARELADAQIMGISTDGRCRSKRNAAEYDAANAASESEADELLDFAKEFERRTRRWLRDRGYS
jgi:hypothetical protein